MSQLDIGVCRKRERDGLVGLSLARTFRVVEVEVWGTHNQSGKMTRGSFLLIKLLPVFSISVKELRVFCETGILGMSGPRIVNAVGALDYQEGGMRRGEDRVAGCFCFVVEHF